MRMIDVKTINQNVNLCVFFYFHFVLTLFLLMFLRNYSKECDTTFNILRKQKMSNKNYTFHFYFLDSNFLKI